VDTSRSPKLSSHSHHHYYNTSISMLPPPPPAPMARPVPIIRSPIIESCSPEMGVTSSPSPPLRSVSNHNNSGHDSSSVASVVIQHVRGDGTEVRVSSPQTMNVGIGDSIVSPVNRSVMSSPFTTLTRPDHSTFAHVSHHSVSQLFTYPSINQVSGMSGVISPTNLTMFTSPVTTPRTTPRTTPIPRWNTSSTFIPLDENLDYGMMAGLMQSSTNPDVDPPHIIEDRFFSVVHSPDDGTQNLSHATGSGGGPGSSGSGSTPPTPTKSQPT
jgi:nuclear factor I